MKSMKKLSALILSLLLILTAVFIPVTIVASAAELDATQSIVYGKPAAWSTLANAGTFAYGTRNGYMADASLKFTTDGVKTHKDLYNPDGKYLIWALDQKYDISAFALWNYTDKTREVSYEVYVGDSADADLFTEANKVYTHTADGTTGSSYQEATFTDVSGCYVAVLITKGGANYDNDSARIREIAFYGTASETQCAHTIHDLKQHGFEGVANYDAQSIIADTEPYANSSGGASGWKAALTDGISNNGSDNGYASIYADLYGDAQTEVTVTYALDSLYDITGFAVYHGHLTLKHNYKVYVGNDPSTLYSGTPVYTYTYSADDAYDLQVAQLVWTNKSNLPQGKYIGFAITPCSETTGGSRIAELQVFGTKTTAAVAIDREALTSDATTDSLIYNKTYIAAWNDENPVFNAGNDWSFNYTGHINDYQSGIAKLTDGTAPNSHADYFAYYTKMAWQLDDTYKIESFLLYNRPYNNQVTAYKVYASENYEDLFDDDNLLYYYDYLKDPETRVYDASGNISAEAVVDADKLTSRGQYVDFYGAAAKNANYVGVWLMDTETSTTITTPSGSTSSTTSRHNKNFRINEIAFFGTKVADTNLDTVAYGNSTTVGNYTNSAAVDATFTYENSLLKNDILTVKNASGTVVTTDYSALMDNAFSQVQGSYAKGSTFTYAFGTVTEVTGFALWRSNANYMEGYEVYVSYSATDLYNENNRVFKYDWSTFATRSMREVVKFAEAKTGMYLGVKFTGVSDGGDWGRVMEMAAWGNQEDLGYTINPSIATTSDVSTLSTYENLIKGILPTTGYPGAGDNVDVTDGDATAGRYWDIYGNAGYETTEMIFDIGYVSDIYKFALWETNADRKFSYEVYMGESYDTMFAEPVFTWNYSMDTASYGQSIEFDEAKSARYVAVRVTDTSVSGDGARIGEVAVYGEHKIAGSDFVEIEHYEIEYAETPDKITYSTTFKFPKGILADATITQIGAVMYPTNALTDELTLGTENAAIAIADSDSKVMEYVTAYDEAGYTAVNADVYFTGVSALSAKLKLSVRSFITVKYDDENTVTYYSDVVAYNPNQLKRIAAKELKGVYENDTDYITNKEYNGDIDTVWSTAMASKTNLDTKQSAALSAAKGWIDGIKEQYSVTDEMLANGLVSYGDSARVANVIRKLLRGESITLVQIGGSITQGYHSTASDLSQGAQVYNFLNTAFPGKVTFVNAGIAATGAVYGAHRLASDVLAYNPDLVIMEYNINDSRDNAEGTAAYENIIRTLYSEDIALITLYNMIYAGDMGNAMGSREVEENVNTFYNVPRVDAVAAYYGADFYTKSDAEGSHYGANDGTHPTDAGHARVAVLTANLIYNLMNNIMIQDTEAEAVPTNTIRPAGSYIATDATIVKAQDINAGSALVSTDAATYNEATQSVGSTVVLGEKAESLTGIRANNTFANYTIASGESASFTLNNVTDAFMVVLQNSLGSKAAEVTVTDTETGEVISTGTLNSYYSGSLTLESSRVINSDNRVYHGDAKSVTVTIKAVDGNVYIGGVMASFASN